jgi:hypothetical protein
MNFTWTFQYKTCHMIINKRYGLTTFVINAELIFLQCPSLPLTQGINKRVWDVNLKTFAAILSHCVPITSCTCSFRLVFSYAKYNIYKVLPVKGVPPIELWASLPDRDRTSGQQTFQRLLRG